MEVNVPKELAAVQRMGVPRLREKYAEVFGEATATGNRTWLVRKIAWRVQANAEGDLSERARQRAAELARDADLRAPPPRGKPPPPANGAGGPSHRPAPAAEGRRPAPASGHGAGPQVQGRHGP